MDLTNAIVVTHFINPHLFWYYEENSYLEEYESLKNLEHELQYICKEKASAIKCGLNLKIGDEVAVFYLKWNKFIRTAILYRPQIEKDDFVVWSIDYGFPFLTKETSMRLMPKFIMEYKHIVKRGGVAGILPAKLLYDYSVDLAYMEIQDSWSQQICDTLQKKLLNAHLITYVVHYQTINKHHWGNLIITDHNGKSISVRDSLIMDEYGVEGKSNYESLSAESEFTKIIECILSDSRSRLQTNFNFFDEERCVIPQSQLPNVTSSLKNAGNGKFNNSGDTKSVSIADAQQQHQYQQKRNKENEKPIYQHVSIKTVNQFNIPTYIDNKTNGPVMSPRLPNKVIHAKHVEQSPKKVYPKKAQIGYNDGIKRSVKPEQFYYEGSEEGAQCRLLQGSTAITVEAIQCNNRIQETPSSSLVHKTECISPRMRKILKERARMIDNTTKCNTVKSSHILSENSKDKSDMLDQKKKLLNALSSLDVENAASDAQSNAVKSITACSESLNQKYPYKKILEKTKSKSITAASTEAAQKLHDYETISTSNSLTNNKPNKLTPKVKSLVQQQRNAPTIMLSSLTKLHNAKGKENSSNFKSHENNQCPITCNNKTAVKHQILNSVPDQSKEKMSKFLKEASPHNDATSRGDCTLKSITKMHIEKQENLLRQSPEGKRIGNDNILDSKALSANKAENIINKMITASLTFPNKTANTTSNHFQKLPLKSISLNMTSNAPNDNSSTKNNAKELIIKDHKYLPFAAREVKFNTNFIKDLMLAHSIVPLNPIENIIEAAFFPEIYEAMHNMCITNVWRTQAYSWPHILRGNSCFMVNPMKSGKTWSYLPAICNMVYYREANHTSTYGPIAIILVASEEYVQQLTELSRCLFHGFKTNAPIVVPSFGIRNFIETKIGLLNACGLLIATPSSFLSLINNPQNEVLFDAKRIQHIVIDDLDIIQKRMFEDLQSTLKIIFKMCKKMSESSQSVRTSFSPQLIVTSKHWDVLMAKLIRASNQPLLVIGDFLEAAVYARVIISIKLVSHSLKCETILKFIQKQQKQKIHGCCSTLIMCNSDDDVQLIELYLRKCGYPIIALYTNPIDSNTDLHIINDWKKKISDQILICTDDRLRELHIKNAWNLIHYSMATNYTTFTQRFSTLIDSYENLIYNIFTPINKCNSSDVNDTSTYVVENTRPQSLIILDEGNNIHLPQLIDFMVSHNQNVHPDVLAAAKCERRILEMEHMPEGSLLCPQLLEFGDCINYASCSSRHVLLNSDIITPDDDIPKSGELRVHIFKVFSPTHYMARLIEHKPINSTKWLEVRRSTEVAQFLLKLNVLYCKTKNLTVHWPPKLNDICIYIHSECYKRARIINLSLLKETTNYKATIKLIDDGLVISNVQGDDLFQCPQEFIDFPALAIDLRLCNVVPRGNERLWDETITKQVKKWIIEDITENQVLQVDINFSLVGTIWINNLVIMEELSAIRSYRIVSNIKKLLIKEEFAILYDTGNKKSIREIFEEHITFLKAINSKNNNSVNNNSQNSTSESIYESIQNNNLPDLERNNIKREMQEEENVQTPQNETSDCSVVLDNNNSNKDTEKYNNVTKVRNNGMWCDLKLNEMMLVQIGDENNNGRWENIFLQLYDKEHSIKFVQLTNLIKQHIEKQQQELKQKNACQWEACIQLKRLHNCIIKHDNLYLRAQLCAIFGNEPEKYLYRFFLCDYAHFITFKAIELKCDDVYYETTEEIINFTPYQAVHCTLAGVQWDCFCKRHKVTADYLYAYGVEKNNIENRSIILSDLSINSYKILLYECKNYNDFKSAQMFNLTLLERRITTSDPDTEHFLKYEVQLDTEETNYGENKENSENIDISNHNNDDQVITAAELMECVDSDVSSDFLNAVELYKMLTQPLEQELQRTPIEDCTTQKRQEEKEAVQKEVEEEQENKDDLNVLPPLKAVHRRPETTWHETDCIIYLSIRVPDVRTYFLEVTASSVQFATSIHDVDYALILNLLGCVVPALVSHEIRGLNVIVRLVKAVYMKWPRLLLEETKYSWLKYNYDADSNDYNFVNPKSQLCTSNTDETMIKYVDDSSSDSEKDCYQTHNDITDDEDCGDL